MMLKIKLEVLRYNIINNVIEQDYTLLLNTWIYVHENSYSKQKPINK